MHALFYVIYQILGLIQILLIVTAILSWLVAFDIINMHNELARSIWRTLRSLTDPILAPIRRIVPNLGGVDISPIIAYFGILLVQKLIEEYFLNGR